MTKDSSSQAVVPMDELRRVVKLMKDNDLSFFQFEKDGYKVKMRRGPEPGAYPVAYAQAPAAAAAPAAVASGQVQAGTTAPAAKPEAEGEEITSPMVGTFFRSPSPGAEMFVNPGDHVTEGQTLCIIEAMKVMNEIKAEKSGTIIAAVAEDCTPVQFGEVLFRIK